MNKETEVFAVELKVGFERWINTKLKYLDKEEWDRVFDVTNSNLNCLEMRDAVLNNKIPKDWKQIK